MKFDLNQIAEATQGQILQTVHAKFDGVGTDTRSDLKNKIFVALKGETFDAHNFLENAVKSGATGLIVHRSLNQDELEKLKNVSIIRVNDTLKALQDWAHSWRLKMLAKIIGITGTNGKTSSKDFAHAILSTRYRTIATKGNLNNFIGLPLSLLNLTTQTEVGIFEMGLSVPGEMELLTKIAQPDISVVTSVGRGHLEGMGSIDGVAEHKSHIYKFAPSNAIRIFNLDNPWTKKMKDSVPKGSTVLTVSSEDSSATVFLKEQNANLEALEITGVIAGEPGVAVVPVFGRHNLANLGVAAAVALAVGMKPAEIWQALPKCRGYWGRNQLVRLKSGARVLFDAYNANPESVAVLMKNFSRVKATGKRIGIFGDMLEMGPDSGLYHAEWGELAVESGFSELYFIGKMADDFERGAKQAGFKKNIVKSNTYKDFLAPQVRDVLQADDVVVFKGSRGMKLEKVLIQLDPENFSETY